MTVVNVTGGGGGGSSGVIYTTMSTGSTYKPSTITVPTNPVGGAGTYFTSGTGTSGPVWTNPNQHSTITITGKNPSIKTERSEINLDELADLVKILKERMLVIIPDFEKHEKYAALKKAYDHYKLIEAMIQEDKK